MKTDQLEAFLKAKTAVTAVGGLLLAAVIAAAGYFLVQHFAPEEKPDPEITLSASLEKIINVSELSTFSAVYNGITQVYNKENPEKIDYYVSYQGQIKAGIDFEKIEIQVSPEESKVVVSLPEARILSTPVDIGSLDFIFYNQKANTSEVSSEAYQACCADIEAESKRQSDIVKMAGDNAENVVRALTQPFLTQFYQGYELEIERGGAQ